MHAGTHLAISACASLCDVKNANDATNHTRRQLHHALVYSRFSSHIASLQRSSCTLTRTLGTKPSSWKSTRPTPFSKTRVSGARTRSLTLSQQPTTRSSLKSRGQSVWQAFRVVRAFECQLARGYAAVRMCTQLAAGACVDSLCDRRSVWCARVPFCLALPSLAHLPSADGRSLALQINDICTTGSVDKRTRPSVKAAGKRTAMAVGSAQTTIFSIRSRDCTMTIPRSRHCPTARSLNLTLRTST